MASSNLPPIPPALKPIQLCMKVAADVEKMDPVVAYWCRFYCVQNGLRIDSKSKESVAFLTTVMDWLETEKKRLHDNEAVTNEMVGQAHVENYALQLFNKADNEDRAGNANKNTFKLFFLSANLFDVLTVFGEVNEEVVKRAKYAKWKAAYINKCIRNNETPIPGPVAGTDAEEFYLSSHTNEPEISDEPSNSGLPSHPPQSFQPSHPSQPSSAYDITPSIPPESGHRSPPNASNYAASKFNTILNIE